MTWFRGVPAVVAVAAATPCFLAPEFQAALRVRTAISTSTCLQTRSTARSQLARGALRRQWWDQPGHKEFKVCKDCKDCKALLVRKDLKELQVCRAPLVRKVLLARRVQLVLLVRPAPQVLAFR
jgi:hypothetical protein